jgi:hypothetical protein
MNLYELTAEARQLADMLDADDLSDAVRAQAEEIQSLILAGLIPAKVEAYCHVIARQTADADLLRDEERRLAVRRRIREASVDRMKAALKAAMESTEQKKMVAGSWTVTVQSSPPSLDIANGAEIPDAYMIPQPPTVDRLRLREAVKGGLAVPGVTLKSGTHVRIR